MLKASLDETLNNKKGNFKKKEKLHENTINSKAIKIEEKK